MSSSGDLKIFITGGTGYIGGSVLDRLLKHPRAGSFHITALVRTEDKAKGLKSLGVVPVLGSYDDLDILEKQASLADYVFAVADSDNEKANVAILKGLKAHHQETGQAATLIHTSGIAFLSDGALGAYATDKIWSDSDFEAIEAIPATAFHRPVDTVIIDAAKDGYVKTFIIVPGIVYGSPSGRLVDLGIQKPLTIVFKALIQMSLARGSTIVGGEGKNYWAYVHVEDCADLFLVLFNNALAGKDFGNGREGIYFAENGEHTFGELSGLIGAELHALKKLPTAAPTPAQNPEEAESFFYRILAGNARCKGDRSRAAGWKPIFGDEKFVETAKKDIAATVQTL